MSENTKIEWCDHSWSPWRGCTKVSPGCANCYAETLSKRNPAVLGQWGRGKPRVLAKNWNDPVRWDKRSLQAWDAERGKGLPFSYPRRPTVFPSLCDWLDEEVPVEWLARFLQLIHETPNLTWLLLTKRPENWYKRISLVSDQCCPHDSDFEDWVQEWIDCVDMPERGSPPQNVWVGASAENQEWADKRISALLKIPTVGRFLSVEPMLGPVDLEKVTQEVAPGFFGDCLQWYHRGRGQDSIPFPTVDWVIFGGESGPGARPCNVDWIRSGVKQCKAAGVSPFVKQLGKHAVGSGRCRDCADDGPICPNSGLPCGGLKHPKGGDMAEWPEDLRVREFPEGLR